MLFNTKNSRTISMEEHHGKGSWGLETTSYRTPSVVACVLEEKPDLQKYNRLFNKDLVGRE
jgi:hypothetical protein